jgi:hypothetical protein
MLPTQNVNSNVSARSTGREDYIVIGVDQIGASHVYRTFDETVLVIDDGEIEHRYDLEALGKDVNEWIEFVEWRRGGFEEQYLYKSAADALGGAF